MVRRLILAICLVVGLGGCAEGDDTGPSDDAAPGPTTTRTYNVPQDAKSAYCSAADLLTAAPGQPASEANGTFRRAAEDLDLSREQIAGTEMSDRAVKSSLGALVSTVRLAVIATATGDDAGRRTHEASIETSLSTHSADCP